MLRNYLTVAFRTLLKNKLFSFINILGLALGMACSLIILLWVQDEWKKDRFHANSDRLYSVMETQYYFGQEPITFLSNPGILAENLKKDIPEIEKACSYSWEGELLFTVGQTFAKEKGRYMGNDFLTMFTLPWQKGDKNTALLKVNSVVISEKMARRYFPNQDPIGKTIRVDNKDDLMVTGVFGEISKNSSLKFDFLISWENFLKDNEWAKEWTNNGPCTYVMLNKNASLEKVNAKISGYIDQKKKIKTKEIELFLHKYTDSYLYAKFTHGVQDGGRIEYVQMFIVIAVFILVIACINFMNLATARSVKRSKEVGIRKVVGAFRQTLIRQFIGESILISFLGLLLGLLIVTLMLPTFNALTEKELSLDFTSIGFLLMLLCLTLLTGVLAGSYPALFLSSLNPVLVLKGSLKFNSGATLFRKGLVVFQFALSMIMIIGMVVVYRQIQYIQTKNLGFDKESLVCVPLEGDLQKNYPTFRNELSRRVGVLSVSAMQHSPMEIGSSTIGVTWAGKDTTQRILFSQTAVDYNYLKTMGIQLLEGRDFSPEYGTDSANYIINEGAAKKMGFKHPVGQEITFWDRKGKIIGLVKDFHFGSLHSAIEPLIIRFQKDDDRWGSILVRTEQGKAREAIASTEGVFKKFNPKYPFEYKFTDQELNGLYKSENIVGQLSFYFAFLAIFISCLGLFGLAAFTAEQRTKEIGIRKVLGASVTDITTMLSQDFIKLFLLATVIAFPVAWYFTNQWLEKYVYRIDIEWWYFVVSALVAILISMLTVSFQAIKAALINPVKSLKSE